MHAPVILAVFSIRLGVASRKTALPCVFLAHRPCRRGLPAPPERAPVQAPGAWFRDVAFLTGAVPGQFNSPANDVPRGLPSLSVVPNPPAGGFPPSNRRRCPSLYHMRAKAIYHCRSTARPLNVFASRPCGHHSPAMRWHEAPCSLLIWSESIRSVVAQTRLSVDSKHPPAGIPLSTLRWISIESNCGVYGKK